MTNPFALHPKLVAEELLNDPRIAQAKQLLLDAVKTHKQKLSTIRPSIPALRENYQKLLKDMAECRGSKLWFPYLGSGIGNGALVELLDGSVKYDFISGIGVHFWGHSNLDVIATSIDAALSNTVMQGNLMQNADSLELANLLTKAAGLDHCFFSTSGAMANENAIKIAFQKRYPANRILAFERCFAGRTLLLSQMTDKPTFREGLPTAVSIDYIPFFDPLRAYESTQEALTILKKYLTRYPQGYALMQFELVQGEGGFYPGSQDFFKALMQMLKEHQVSILVDEIQTFGRTSQLFAFQHFGLEQYVDLVTIGKLSHVCATLFTKAHNPRPGLLSQTFTASTATIRIAQVIILELLQGNYFGENGKNMQVYDYFVKKLTELETRHPDHLKGPFGIGAMIALTPFDGSEQRTKELALALFDSGVLSFVAGLNPTRLRFLMPVGAITWHDIDAVVKILEETLVRLK